MAAPKKYATEAERLEARRNTWNRSKRKAKPKIEARHVAVEDFLNRMFEAHQGPPERRQMILDILQKQREAS